MFGYLSCHAFFKSVMLQTLYWKIDFFLGTKIKFKTMTYYRSMTYTEYSILITPGKYLKKYKKCFR